MNEENKEWSGGAAMPETTPLPDESADAFPTSAKVREKERRAAAKEAGVDVTPKKKPKIIEDHYDDCGDCLESLDFVMGSVDAIYDEAQADIDKADDQHMAEVYPVDISKVRSAPCLD